MDLATTTPADRDPPTTAASTATADDATSPSRPRHRWRRRLLIALGVLLVLLIAARLALAPVVLWYVNRTLDLDPLYDGQVESIDINLWRGAYSINGITLINEAAGVSAATTKPLLEMQQIDLSLQWSSLLSGEIVGEVTMQRPIVNFVDGSSDSTSQTGSGGAWLEMLQQLLPFTINQVVIHDGEVHFYSERFADAPPISAYLSDIQATVTDLTNVRDQTKPLVTQAHVTAKAMGQAEIELEAAIDPFSYHPTFELALRMLDFDITQINALAQAYGGVDFQGGRFDLTVEADAVNGQVQGVIQPLFRNLEVFTVKQDLEQKSPLNAAWQLLIGVAGELLENQPRDQVGTRLKFEYNPAGLDLSVFEVISNILHNAFIQAYLPKLRQSAGRGFEFEPTTLEDSP